jgi:16S rRNA (guanine527-N7)-methyltransferase
MTFRELLGTELSPEQLDKLEAHYRLLLQWNQRMNLTRIRNDQEAVELHYHESLFLAKSLPGSPLRIADVGSGGGFPGIPIAILREDSHVDLIESHQRKAVFLREAARGLPNISVIANRAEAITEQYDWVVSRAVRPADVLKLKLASNFAILTTPPELRNEPKTLIRIPWGNNRVLAMFHVEH